MQNLEEIKQNIQRNYERLTLRMEKVAPLDAFLDVNEVQSRINSVHTEFASTFDNSIEDYKYNGLNNTIIVNKKYLERADINPNNLLMDMVLQISFYDDKTKTSGFGSNIYEALNKGFREMLAINITQENRSQDYFESDEYVYANLFCRLFDVSILQKAFFQKNPEMITDLIRDKSVEQGSLFKKMNEEANRNMKVRFSKQGQSSLDKIQIDMMDFLVSENPEKKEVDDFLDNTVSSPYIFKEESKYRNLPLSSHTLNKIYLDYVKQSQNDKTY